MFFKLTGKLLDKLKNIFSVLSFFCIAMSVLFFIYWLLYAFGFDNFPKPLNNIVWGSVDLFFGWWMSSAQFKEVMDILPVLSSILYGILAYLINCTIVSFGNMQKEVKKTAENYRQNLENKINSQLHSSFLDDLKTNSFMLIKIKTDVSIKTSYLTNPNAVVDNSKDIEKNIEETILNSIDSPNILKKGLDNSSLYIVISNLAASKDFLTHVVNTSVSSINKYLKENTTVSFYCCAEVFSDLQEFEEKSVYLNRVLALKISNKIAITPKFKMYYENLFPSFYYFKVLGEYNLNASSDNTKNTTLYTIQRK